MSHEEETIWKFTVEVTDSPKIKVDGAFVRFLSARKSPFANTYNGSIDLWAIVIPDPEMVQIVPIEIRGTGHPLRAERFLGSPESAFIDTVIDDPFVWHVFRGGLRSF